MLLLFKNNFHTSDVSEKRGMLKERVEQGGVI